MTGRKRKPEKKVWNGYRFVTPRSVRKAKRRKKRSIQSVMSSDSPLASSLSDSTRSDESQKVDERSEVEEIGSSDSNTRWEHISVSGRSMNINKSGVSGHGQDTCVSSLIEPGSSVVHSIGGRTSEDTSEDTHKDTFVSELRVLVNDYPAIPGRAITRLLKILKKHKKCIADEKIPKTFRSLVKTPRTTLVQAISEKETFHYFGIKIMLEKYSSIFQQHNVIEIGTFIDGVEGDKSTGMVHWPLLARILRIQENVVIPIALFTGYSKPKSIEVFLRPFVDEANDLILNGLLLNNVLYEFRVRLALGDAPARCFFLNTVSHNGFNHCTYCTIRGKRLLNRNFFYEPVPCDERNSDNFKNLNYPELQNGHTPLMDLLNFDILKSCPYDPMHMLMRILRTILGLMLLPEKNKVRRHRAKLYRLRPQTIKLISIHLRQLWRNIPMEFQRKTDDLEKFSRWKASQCRFFILYIGPYILRKRVNKEVYKNFMLLHFSVRLLSMANITEDNFQKANQYLRAFVHTYAEVYGIESVTHYIHALLHLVELVRLHGPLDSFAAYLFESYIGAFKFFKHTAKYPGQQVVNRILERQIASRDLYIKNKRSNKFPTAEYTDGAFPPDLDMNSFKMYSRINLDCCTIISTRDSDNLVLMKDGTIFRVLTILVSRDDDSNIFFYGYCLTDKRDAYTFPEPSSVVQIFEATDDQSTSYLKRTYSVSEFQCKCMGIPLDNNHIQAQCLLH